MSKRIKETKDWVVDMPWGKLAMISWGDSSRPPVLLVHGYVDSAATFLLLVQELPDDYYYVSFDLPGHGKSDPFPLGISVSQLYVIDVIRRVVESMEWQKFIYLAHSMAIINGLFYNDVYPNRISMMIMLDPRPALAMYFYVHNVPDAWYNYQFGDYFENYHRYNTKKSYHYEKALNLTVRNRKLTVEQTEVVLSRSLRIEGDKRSFYMDPRMKTITNIPVSEETLCKVLSSNTSPTLILEASKDVSIEPGTSFALNILEKSTGSNYCKS